MTGIRTQIRDGAQQTVYFDNAVVSPDQRFEYDSLYRLTHAEGREHTSLTQPTHVDLSFGPQPHPNDPSALRTYEQDYAWDEVGNLVQLQHAAAGGNFTRQYVYAAAGNRLLSNSAPGESTAPFSHSYTYDAHGNMTSMPHLAAMAWDHADRLQHCDLGGGGDVWFVYDAAGNRVRKVQVNTSGSTVSERIYVGAWEVWRQRTGTPLAVEQERQTLHVGDDRGELALVETLTVDDGDPVATPTPIQRHQHGNHLGSASLELDANAAVISYEELHPFGTTSYAANDSGIEVSAKRYRYIGKERDEETGLYHLGARYYASWLGRWTAADPIGLGDGVNRYAYAGANPVRLADPRGTRAGDPLDQVDRATGTSPPAPETAEADARRQRGRDLADRAAASADRDEGNPASVSLGIAGAALAGEPREDSSRTVWGAKVFPTFYRIVTRKESPQLAKVAKDIGFLPRVGSGKTTAPEHALEEKLSDSPWVSASERRGGAPGFEGDPVRIDVDEAVRTGSEYVSHKDLVKQVKELAQSKPSLAHRAGIWLGAQLGENAEREAVLKGPVEASAIESNALRGARRAGNVLGIAGTGLSAYRIATASPEERTQVIAEEGAGWAGASIGAQVGARALAGTGPWGGLIGGVVGGALGAMGAAGYVTGLFDLANEPPPPEHGIIADQPGLLFRHAA